MHPACFEAGEGFVYRLSAFPPDLQELDDETGGRLHLEATVPALEATEKDLESALYDPGYWVPAPVAELSDGHLPHQVACGAPKPLGDRWGLELRSQFRAT